MENEELELTNENEELESETEEEYEDSEDEEESSEDEVEEESEEELEDRINMTQEEFDNAMQKRLDRQKRSLSRDFNKELSKYERTSQILSATFGTDDIDEINEKMEDYFREEGIEIPEIKAKGLTKEEIEILGNAEAHKIIELGDEEIVDELDRMKNLGYDNLSEKEKVIYKTLYEDLTEKEDINNLKKNGIDTSILQEDSFKKFKSKFSKNADLLEIVNMYNKLNDHTTPPAKIGSLKSEKDKGEKIYTSKEIDALTDEDLDKPGVWEAVRRSMTKNKK